MAHEILPFVHIFVDHSNVWGGARAATRIRDPSIADHRARISVRNLDRILGGSGKGLSTKIVSGGVPPGMEKVWAEYQKSNYDTQRLFRDLQWRERGVDHAIIGHIWRLVALYQKSPTVLVLASGDGKRNEFGTSFYELLYEILKHQRYSSWHVKLASFDWDAVATHVSTPTARKMRRIVEDSERGEFINLMDHYPRLVYHEVGAVQSV